MHESTWKACPNPGHWALPRVSDLADLRWGLRICDSHNVPVMLMLMLLVQEPTVRGHFFEGLKLLGVCPLPYLGLAPLQGPRRSGQC